MTKNEKSLGVGEKITNFIKSVWFAKSSAKQVIEETKKKVQCKHSNEEVLPFVTKTTTTSAAARSFNDDNDDDDTKNNNNSNSNSNKTAVSELPSQVVVDAVAEKGPDDNDVVLQGDDECCAFLDSVLAGNHETLLKEINCASALSGGERDKKSDGTGHFGKAHVSLDVSFDAVELKQSQRGQSEAQQTLDKTTTKMETQTRFGAGSSAARLLKDYELVAHLGKGTFAEVTLARHKSTKALFALKKISKRKVREAGFVQSTFTERQLLVLYTHPFLVKLHSAFQSPTHLYLLLDFAQGGDMFFFLESKPWVRDMRRKLRREKKACLFFDKKEAQLWESCKVYDESNAAVDQPNSTPPRLLPLSGFNESFMQLAPDDSRAPIRLIAFYAIELALVLHYLHGHGFVYYDLKPENVLMMRDGNVVLTDFGVSKYRGARGSGGGGGDGESKYFTGTTQYMSPEMLLGKPHDKRIDWWSFGCFLFEMATGRRPFQLPTQYGVVKAIVEADVEVHEDDFIFTELELETRVMQLHNLYQQFLRGLMKQSRKNKNNNDLGEEKNLMSCDYEYEKPLSRIASVLPQVADDGSVYKYESTEFDLIPPFTCDTSRVSNYEMRDFWLPMSSEERAVYMQHAKEEMNEACRLLKDLILSLLERRVELRLSGEDVLNHPFFSCAYVVSQLYEKHQTMKFNFESSGLQRLVSLSRNITCDSPCTPAEPILLFPPLALQRTISASSTFTVLGKSVNDNNDVDNVDEHSYDNDLDNVVAGLDVTELRKRINVQYFLDLPPPQRPLNWRELFLERKIEAPYIPRLFAADDLRYFPGAVTATGDSVLMQQNVLRKHVRRRSSYLIFCEGHDNSPESHTAKLSARLRGLSQRCESSGREDFETPRREIVTNSSLGAVSLATKQSVADSQVDEPLNKMDTSQIPLQENEPLGLCSSHSSREFGSRLLVLQPKSMTQQVNFCGPKNECVDASVPCVIPSGDVISATAATTEPTTTTMEEKVEEVEQHSPEVGGNADVLVLETPRRRDGTRQQVVHISTPDLPPSFKTPILVRKGTRNAVSFCSFSGCINKQGDFSYFVVPRSQIFNLDETEEEEEEEEESTNREISNMSVSSVTLHGVAYDVDDYVPSASQEQRLVLQSRTGIPQRRSVRRAHELNASSFPQHEAGGSEKCDALPTADDSGKLNKRKELFCLSLCDVEPSATAAATTDTKQVSGGGGGGCESEPNNAPAALECGEVSSTLSLISPKKGSSTASVSPLLDEVRSISNAEGELVTEPLPHFRSKGELCSLIDSTDLSAASHVMEKDPPFVGYALNNSVSYSGAVHHYMGFTYTDQNGVAFLLGGETSGSGKSKWFCE